MKAPAPKPQPPSSAVRSDAHWAATMERLRNRKLPRRTLRICDDDALRTAHDQARRAADRARLLADTNPDSTELASRAAQLEAELETARAALDAASLFLRFQALPRPLFEELINDHPATEEQSAEGAAAFNADTFPAALIAASCLDGMSEADAAELLATWSAPDANSLWETAWSVQQEGRIDLGKD
uniref:Uncharacterized protein n=1 Tax=Streptomyces sp. NBC_00003 TaxID=2903608 RepID=A0AAU2V6Y6_9ACTN